MPKPVTTNEQIAQGIIKVLKKEHIAVEELKKKVPKRFWDKVREEMGDGPPDKGTISARWNRPSSGPQIRELVESLLSVPGCRGTAEAGPRQDPCPDTMSDPHIVEPSADIETDSSQDLDPSIVVDLDAEDLISMGVMSEPVDVCDACDPEATDSVDLYARDEASLVDTIDIETETWPTDVPSISDETIIIAEQLEIRLKDHLDKLVHDVETRLTRLVQSLVHTAVEGAVAEGELPFARDREECPVVPDADAGVRSIPLPVRIDSNLFELFDAECRLRYHGNASQAMNAILWQHYGKPRLSFESGSAPERKKR